MQGDSTLWAQVRQIAVMIKNTGDTGTVWHDVFEQAYVSADGSPSAVGVEVAKAPIDLAALPGQDRAEILPRPTTTRDRPQFQRYRRRDVQPTCDHSHRRARHGL